jgi:hypothetical protein
LPTRKNLPGDNVARTRATQEPAAPGLFCQEYRAGLREPALTQEILKKRREKPIKRDFYFF